VLGLAVGVALLFASQVASSSLAGSIQQLTAGVVGRASLQLVARAPDGFDERLLGRVRRLPGVQGAEPVLEQRATVLGPLGQRSVDLLAGEPRYLHLGGGLLAHFTLAQLAALRMIALPAPLARAIGVDSLQMVTLELGASRLTVLMGATLDAGDVGALVNSPVALAPLAYAQALTGLRGRVTRILVLTRPGHAREVRRELAASAAAAQANLEPADHDAQLFDTAAAPADQSEELFSAISALVGFLFAFNALLVTVHLRRGLVALLRRQGATRPMLVQVLLFDALVLGVLGSLLGLALGEALSIAVFRANPGYLAFAFAVGAQRLVSWQSVALAAGTGLAAACVGVLAPLYGVLRARLRTPAPRAGAVRMRVALRTALGAGCLSFTTAVLLVRPQSAILGAVALVAALLLLLPLCFDALLVGFERLQRPLYAASTRLALIELGTPSNRTRSLAIAATGAVAVFGSVAVEGARLNLQRGLDASVRDLGANAAVWVSPQGEADAFTTIPFGGRRCGTWPACRASPRWGCTAAASWTGGTGASGCSRRRVGRSTRCRPPSSCGVPCSRPPLRCARAVGWSSRSRWRPPTTCASVSASSCPHLAPPCSGSRR